MRRTAVERPVESSPLSELDALADATGITRVTTTGGTVGSPSGSNFGTFGRAGGRAASAVSIERSAAASLAFWAASTFAEIGGASFASAPRFTVWVAAAVPATADTASATARVMR